MNAGEPLSTDLKTLCCQYADTVSLVDTVVYGLLFPVHQGSLCMVTDFRMDPVREVEHAGSFGELIDVTFK